MSTDIKLYTTQNISLIFYKSQVTFQEIQAVLMFPLIAIKLDPLEMCIPIVNLTKYFLLSIEDNTLL